MTVWGVHMDMGYFSASEHQAELEAARDKLAVSMARHTMVWHRIEGTQGVFNWSVYDSIIEKSEALGLDSMFMLATSPSWARGGVGDLYTVPDAGSGVTSTFETWAGHYATFVTEAVRRYKPGGSFGSNVTYWEVWNEPNVYPSFWKGGGVNDPDQYAYIYDLAYAAIKLEDPGAEVGFGVTVEWEAYNKPARTFMESVLAADGVNGAGGRVVDNMSYHLYGGANQEQPPYLHFYTQQNFDDVGELRRWMIRNQMANVPIWITEFGWNSDTVGVGQQGQYVQDFLKIAKRRYIPDLGVTIFVAFSHKDGLGGTNHGLLDTSLNLKSAGTKWVQQITSGRDDTHGPTGLVCKVVNMGLPTSTGNHAVTGVGFKPKAFIAFCSGRTADGAGDGNVGSFGVSDVIISRVASWTDDDGVNPSASHTAINDALIRVIDSAGTEIAEATILTADDDGFTLNVTTASSAYHATILCLGGSDIERSTVVDVDWSASETGEWQLTEPGFIPDFMFHVWTYQGIQFFPSASGGVAACFGATDMLRQQLLAVETVDNVSPSVAGRRHSSTRFSGSTYSQANVAVTGKAPTTGALLERVSAASTDTMGFLLALKGGRWYVGQETQRTSIGTRDTDVGFRPVGLFTMSHASSSADSIVGSNWVSSFGASDGSTHGSCGYGSQTFSVTANTGVYRDSSHAVLMPSSTPPLSVAASADIAFTSSGFTADWDAADATARVFSYVAFSGTSGGRGRKGEPPGRSRSHPGGVSGAGRSTPGSLSNPVSGG